MHRTLVVAAAAALAAGCHTPAGGDGVMFRVETDRREYVPGDAVVVTTRNLSTLVAYDDHCGGEMQGYEFLGRWNASYGMGRACFEGSPRRSRVPIAPGAAHVDTFYVNAYAYRGTWRVELALVDGTGRLLPERASNTFRVQADQAP